MQTNNQFFWETNWKQTKLINNIISEHIWNKLTNREGGKERLITYFAVKSIKVKVI